MRIVLALLATAVVTAGVYGQSFDVATVKPTPSENAGPVEPSIVQFLPNGFRRTNSTLRTLVRTAYDVQEYQVRLREYFCKVQRLGAARRDLDDVLVL